MSGTTTILTLVAIGGITYYLYLKGSPTPIDNSNGYSTPDCQGLRHWTEQEKYDCWIKNNPQNQ